MTLEGMKHVKTDYTDPNQLAEILKGVHTVLSFITTASDPGNRSQKNLIDASVKAGVKRFAPSEWASYVNCLPQSLNNQLVAHPVVSCLDLASNTCLGTLGKMRFVSISKT